MKLRNMKRNSFFVVLCAVLAMIFVGCKDKRAASLVEKPVADSIVPVETVADTTVYGVCGEGTSMHSLELVTTDGDTIYYQVNVEEDAHLRGGMMVGDRLAVVGYSSGDEGMVAQGVINLTTLLGKWSSIDRNFEIQDGGALITEAKEPQVAEWKICNGLLVLRTDTFSVYELGPDSLCLENKNGIYAYKRVK